MRRTLIGGLAALAMLVCASPALANVPGHPAWTSSARFGAWHHRSFIVYNNAWNQTAGPQTIWAYSASHMGVKSTQPAGNTAVVTYPCVQKNFSNPRVSSFRLIRNGFAQTMPAHAGLNAAAADDIWLNNYKLEVMIWVDNQGQRPAGKIIGHVTISGQHFTVWRGASFTFALDRRETSGVTHILSAINWLIGKGDVASDATLTQVNFGWAIASTDGNPLDFNLTKYWLHTTH